MKWDTLTVSLVAGSLLLLLFLYHWWKTGNDSHPTLKWFFALVGAAVALIFYVRVFS